jgi:LEA14-like dessication related protein
MRTKLLLVFASSACSGVAGRHGSMNPAHPLALAALLALGGCASVRSILGAGFERPTLAYESWSANDLDLDGVTIALHYRLQNPNGFGLDLRRLGYRLEVEGRRVAEGSLPGGLQIRAQGATPIAIPVRLRWREVPGFVELLLTRAEVAYRVSGDVGVGSPLGTLDIPFEHEDRVPVPRPPSIGIDGVTVRESSLSNLSLDLRVRVENRNSFPLPAGALTYGLRVGQRDLLSGGSQPLAAVPGGGRATVAIPIRISAAGAAEAVASLLGGAELRLQGLAEFGPMQVQVDTPGHVR